MRNLIGRAASAVFLVLFGAATLGEAQADTYVNVDQGWRTRQKTVWYSLSQGSRLIPLDWLKALEQADTQTRFLDPANIEKYRYLPDLVGSSGLPLGFVVDAQNDDSYVKTRLRWKEGQGKKEKWVGMNCAACHTAEIAYKGKRMRIEGAPTLADFQGFMLALNAALRQTKSDVEKFKRFEASIFNNRSSDEDRKLLARALDGLIKWQDKVERANKTPLAYGFGRLDAFGHIFNKATIAVELEGGEQTYHPANAPVSYPFLWNVPQHDKVQWNGLVRNSRVRHYDIGALGRNVGEVTGVFADVSWAKNDHDVPIITSSAEARNLSTLEFQLNSLRAPLWPTGVLGVIDDRKRDRGRELFIDKNRKYTNGTPIKPCADCHKGLRRHDLTASIDAKMTPLKDIGTDIWMACNAVSHESASGILLNSAKPGGGLFREKAETTSIVTATVAGTLFANIGTVLRGIAGKFGVSQVRGLGSTDDAGSALPLDERPLRTALRQNSRNKCLNGTSEYLAYKGRPLTGIWATAPYLHNGSVPTLYDLLLPPDQRPKSFPVGTREFDTKRVGFLTRVSDAADAAIAEPAGDNSFLFQTRDATGRVIDGNSNAGHDYGNALFTDEERWALVEYMKGL